jgi:hypothetical protein
MATLSRPGVEISQEITAAAPTVLTPALVPCVVGPCFQIVEPISSSGALNSDALGSIAARLVNGAALPAGLALSGRRMVLEINGVSVTVTFPVTLNNETISQSLLVNTINKAVSASGAVAEVLDERLVILTTSAGDGMRLVLKAVAPDSESAYGAGVDDILSMNSLIDKPALGQGNYANLAYTVPYSSFPSPLADIGDVVINGADVTAYRFFNGTLTAFSDDSATHWNSVSGGPTKYNNSAVAHAIQPALGGRRTLLCGFNSGSSKSNAAVDIGRDASLKIPLGHAIDRTEVHAASGLMWPDASGENYIEVKAVGYEASFAATKGLGAAGVYKGAAGNGVRVVFAHTEGIAAPTAVYANGVLTITVDADPTVGPDKTSWAQLEAVLTAPESIVTWSSDISVAINRSAGTADADPVLDLSRIPGSWGGKARTFYLGGGVDPVDFTADAAGDDREASVCGAVAVGGGTTAGALGLTNEKLEVSIDGGDWISILFGAADVVATVVNTALGALGSAESLAIVSPHGETVNVLRLSTASTAGHDSTIALRGSSLVLDRLFGGATQGSDTVASVYDAAGWPAGGGVPGRRLDFIQGTDYNTLVTTELEKAIRPGSVDIELQGVRACGQIVTIPVTDALVAAAVGGAKDLIISIDGGTTDITIGLVAAGTVDILVADIRTKLAANGTLGPAVAVGKATMGTDTVIIFSDHTGTGQLRLESGTAATLRGLFGADIFAANSASAAVTVTLTDTGPGNAWQCASISNAMAHAVGVWSGTLTERLLSVTADLDDAYRNYSQGKFVATFRGEDIAAAKDKKALSLLVNQQTSATFKYKRLWACATRETAITDYASKVFHGRSNAALPGDVLYNNGSVLGRVVSLESFDGFAGARLVISEFAFDSSGDTKDRWYLRATQLPSADRVAPEASYSDLSATFSVKQALLRDAAGMTIQGSAPLYLQYKGLRKDVSPTTADPGLLVFNSSTEVESLIGPIDTRNPLAFGLSLAFLNTTNINISALGVDAVSADAPDGTVEAYARSLEFLETQEIYAIAPLSSSLEVHKKLSQHVIDMSVAAAKKERMCVVAPSLPTEKPALLAASATFTMEGIGGSEYELSTSEAINIPLALDGLKDAAGVVLVGGVGQDYSPDQGIYLDRAGDPHKYLITRVSATDKVVIDTSSAIYRPGLMGPATGGNDDGFFQTDSAKLADFEADGESCTILVRQAALDSSTTAGRLLACEALAAISGGVSGFVNRRMVLVQPASVATLVNGTETTVPGYYLCAAIAAMIGQQPPAQPFTNFPMVGFTRPLGSSDKFTETQMSTAAAGGVYWVIQDVVGGPLVSRHQLTTDVSSLKTRELSILKSVDYVAKSVREQIKGFIGRRNITRQLLEAVALGVSATLESVKGSIVADAALVSLDQDTSSPDTIVASVSLVPFYPANRIMLTIYV